MKTFRHLLLQHLVLGCCLCASMDSYSQLSNGGFHANFGVDADTKGGYLKFGPTTGFVNGDDWFGNATGLSRGVIDTTGASVYRSQLQANVNLSFYKGMSLPLYSQVNGTTWLDATYGRDQVVIGGVLDSTSYTVVANNGDDPANWMGGPTIVPQKNDVLDVYAHMRRNGLTIKDSLWFFVGFSTLGTTGNRYSDVELYKNNLAYSPSTGAFGTGGTEMGHTEWKFDAAGNITQTGDMILCFTYVPGVPPLINLRIWVSKTTHTTVIPALFNFGPEYNGKLTTSPYGYASIVSKFGTTAFGSGTGNFSSLATDTTYSTPWGTRGLITGINQWGANYQPLQLIEMGINLTRVGIDPALYSTLGTSACDGMFKSILYKTRAASAFSATLTDFMGPLPFMRTPVLDHTFTNDTLTCNSPLGTLNVASNTTAGNYSWTPINGGTVSASNTDSTALTISSTGRYVLSAAVAEGCPITRRDTITVIADSAQPVASAFHFGVGMYSVQLAGGDPASSNFSTPFGTSQGLTWSWTGPKGFTSSVQNPLTDTSAGTYQLVITEARNGCRDTAVTIVSFVILDSRDIQITANQSQTSRDVVIQWKDLNSSNVSFYEIEKKEPSGYRTLGKIQNSATSNSFSYVDGKPIESITSYRVKAVTKTGNIYYSNAVSVSSNQEEVKLVNQDGNKLYCVVETNKSANCKIVIYDASGVALKTLDQNLVKGINTIEISAPALKNSVKIVAVYINQQLVKSEQVFN